MRITQLLFPDFPLDKVKNISGNKDLRIVLPEYIRLLQEMIKCVLISGEPFKGEGTHEHLRPRAAYVNNSLKMELVMPSLCPNRPEI